MNSCKTPIEDLVDNALKDYEEASKKVHHWNSIIPKSLNFYKNNHKLNIDGIVNSFPITGIHNSLGEVQIVGIRTESDYSKQIMYMVEVEDGYVWVYDYETEIL